MEQYFFREVLGLWYRNPMKMSYLLSNTAPLNRWTKSLWILLLGMFLGAVAVPMRSMLLRWLNRAGREEEDPWSNMNRKLIHGIRGKKGGLQDPSGKNHGEFEISLGKRTGKKSASLRKQGNHRGARDPSVHRGVLPHHSHENSTYINEGLTE